MDTIENIINISMASTGKMHDQSCSNLLKSLYALNDQSGKSIDETAISKLVEQHKESMAKYLQVLSFDLHARVMDALQSRRRFDQTKIQKLVNIANELVDACKDDEDHTELHFQTIGLHGNDLLVYKAIYSSDNSEAGISRTELEALCRHIPRQELFQIIDSLTDSGFCYATSDPDHFMASHK